MVHCQDSKSVSRTSCSVGYIPQAKAKQATLATSATDQRPLRAASAFLLAILLTQLPRPNAKKLIWKTNFQGIDQ